MRTLLVAIVGLVVVGAGVAEAGVAGAAVCAIPPGWSDYHCIYNNGSAPPDPANVIDGVTYRDYFVHVRNVGCPPAWPAGYPLTSCPAPGAPTEVAFTGSGEVFYLYANDSSTVTVSGGMVGGELNAWASASIRMTGGTVEGNLRSRGSSTVTVSGGTMNDLFAEGSSIVTMSGGTVGGEFYARDSSTTILIGTNFMVDGAPVPYGDLSAMTGILTGTLALGDGLDNRFFQGGYAGEYTGTITLPEPTQTLLHAGVLATLALLRRRVG